MIKLPKLRKNSQQIIAFQNIISNFAGYFRVQAFGPIRNLNSETQFLYRRESAKGV